jgi:predicted aldo/keto reductase-like oxidoreductase
MLAAMALDHYVTLGRSGLRVSPLCLGAMTFGEEWGWGSTVKDSEAILDRFLARGGNFIDTANGYTKGHSEKIIGDHLGRDAAKRDRVRLRRIIHQRRCDGERPADARLATHASERQGTLLRSKDSERFSSAARPARR